jgi:Flp pilus assembly protein CpaB
VKRSNRLVIFVGVLLAVLAFVLVVILLNSTGGGGTGENPEEPVMTTVLVATEPIAIGDAVTPEKVEEQDVPPEAVQGTALSDTSAVGGQAAIIAIPARSQVTAESIGIAQGGGVDLSQLLQPGEKAIAFQVDRATGLDFLVTQGDFIDVVLSQQISVLQETADSAANPDEAAPPRFETVTGLENQRSVKAILQNKRVLYVSGTKAIQPEPTTDTNGDGVINEEDTPEQAVLESVIIVFAGTDQDAELIKFAQNDFTEVGALTAVVRHADDDEVETTLGITIDQLVDEYGLRIPNIVESLDTTEETP